MGHLIHIYLTYLLQITVVSWRFKARYRRKKMQLQLGEGNEQGATACSLGEERWVYPLAAEVLPQSLLWRRNNTVQ